MKKLVLIMVAVMGLAFAANAQNNLGVRVGTGTELSWQHGIGSHNRLEFDLGLDGIFNNHEWNFICLSGIYQWHWNIVDKLGWYIGPGATVGFYTWKNHTSELGAAVGGQIGIDYELPIPLQLSLDARPMWYLTNNEYHTGFGWGACLGIRYMF
ncbi:MAG: hypothetical protein IKG95_08370 [Bacteroidales bacterium]|nr:hypothetical protein [Bacteroidales bacterium]